GRHTAVDVFLGREVQMRVEFAFKLLVDGSLRRLRSEARDDGLQKGEHVSAPFVDAKNGADYLGDAAPILGFGVQLFAAGFGDGIKARFPIVFGSAPRRSDPAFMKQADERGVD